MCVWEGGRTRHTPKKEGRRESSCMWSTLTQTMY